VGVQEITLWGGLIPTLQEVGTGTRW